MIFFLEFINHLNIYNIVLSDIHPNHCAPAKMSHAHPCTHTHTQPFKHVCVVYKVPFLVHSPDSNMNSAAYRLYLCKVLCCNIFGWRRVKGEIGGRSFMRRCLDDDISVGSNLGANKNYTLPYKRARRSTVDNKEWERLLPEGSKVSPSLLHSCVCVYTYVCVCF